MPGEIHVLLGASGSGKTTLLRSIGGFERLRSGTLQLGGRLVDDADAVFRPPEDRGLGVVFQDYALFPHLSAVENVRFGCPESGRAEELLERCGLSHRSSERPGALSGGEQQRVALARALAPAPKVLLLDEPFSNLDPELREGLRHQTLSLLKDAGTTALFITHDAAEAMALADRLSVLEGGSLAQSGPPRELYTRPRSLAVARALGPVVLLPATLEEGAESADSPLGRVPVQPGGAGDTLVLRPEQLVLGASDRTGTAARITSRRFLGDRVEVRLSLQQGAHELTVHARPWELPEEDHTFVAVHGAGALVQA